MTIQEAKQDVRRSSFRSFLSTYEPDRERFDVDLQAKCRTYAREFGVSVETFYKEAFEAREEVERKFEKFIENQLGKTNAIYQTIGGSDPIADMDAGLEEF